MSVYSLSILAITFEIAIIISKANKYMQAFQERAKLDTTLKQY